MASGGGARFVRLLSGPVPAVGAALRAPSATGAGGSDGVLRCTVGAPVGCWRGTGGRVLEEYQWGTATEGIPVS